jgi:hypothetical protein
LALKPRQAIISQPKSSSSGVVVCKATAEESTTTESESQRYLRLAKQLREKAAQAEHQVHVDLAKKKAKQDAKTDDLIEKLFFGGPKSGLADRLRSKGVCIDTLEQIVDRLDEREVIAQGKEHVKPIFSENDTRFERVASVDEKELEHIQGLIDDLIEAVKVLDDEFLAEKKKKGELYVSHTEEQHWGGGQRAKRLRNRSQEIRREREEQFQKRLEQFYEAQRIKKDKPPPPKVKDDHGLIP